MCLFASSCYCFCLCFYFLFLKMGYIGSATDPHILYLKKFGIRMGKKSCISICFFTNSRFASGSNKSLPEWPAHTEILCINYYTYTCIGVSKLRLYCFLKARDPTQNVKRTYIELNSDSSFSILLSTHHR